MLSGISPYLGDGVPTLVACRPTEAQPDKQYVVVSPVSVIPWWRPTYTVAKPRFRGVWSIDHMGFGQILCTQVEIMFFLIN